MNNSKFIKEHECPACGGSVIFVPETGKLRSSPFCRVSFMELPTVIASLATLWVNTMIIAKITAMESRSLGRLSFSCIDALNDSSKSFFFFSEAVITIIILLFSGPDALDKILL